ncbi:hypothetical protein J437_LFUL000767 [Ladona fulva]|uniref:SNF2 N-terminal domain-containing protein n=1 Tax=Ladona fulva TaxID=123851 RepID=A0A8K0KQ24_LADFU|nr:hypothetical protein J437_LFUL000767 [Ladona fulva]
MPFTPFTNLNSAEINHDFPLALPVKTNSEETECTPVKAVKRRIAGRVIDSDSDESEEMSMADLRKEIAKNFENATGGLNKTLKNSSTTSDSESEVFNKTDTNLKILAKEFPDMDEMELLDVLARNSMDMKRALNVLRDSNYKGQKEKPKPCVLPKIEEDGNESNNQDLNGTIKRQWKRIRKEKVNPKKNVRKVKRLESDDEDDDDDVNPFTEHKVYESEDSDEENVVDVDTLTSEKCAVLEFFSTATFLELAAVPNCSRKKAEAIISLRPFESWAALVKKLQNNKTLGPELLNASHTVLRLRKTVNRLMQQCKNLSEKMEEIVRSVQSGEIKTASIKEQPRLIPSHLKLASYQMIGLNWFFLMHKQRLSGILADEMGLGKTIQVIALLAYLKEREMDGNNSSDEEEEVMKESDFNEDAKTHLVVCPSSTLVFLNKCDTVD